MLFMNAVSKLFFKMHLVLHLSTNSFDIFIYHSLYVLHLACALLGDMAIFGDSATYLIFREKMVLHIRTL